MNRIARALALALSALLCGPTLAPAASAMGASQNSGAVAATTNRATVATTTRAATLASAASASRATSTSNWAGYRAAVSSPTQIHAAWFVPKATWPGRDGYSSTWVGLGGGTAAQGELVQAGTESDTRCVALRAGRCTSWHTDYYAWVETYPSRMQERITNLPIAPGDAVEATVRWSAAQKRTYFTVCNWRADKCVTTSRASRAPKAVAQAVLERTSGANGVPRALTNVGRVDLSGVTVTNSARGPLAIGRWPLERITMVNRGLSLASAGSLSAGRDAFAVTYHRPA